jgi:hypothetical protein
MACKRADTPNFAHSKARSRQQSMAGMTVLRQYNEWGAVIRHYARAITSLKKILIPL